MKILTYRQRGFPILWPARMHLQDLGSPSQLPRHLAPISEIRAPLVVLVQVRQVLHPYLGLQAVVRCKSSRKRVSSDPSLFPVRSLKSAVLPPSPPTPIPFPFPIPIPIPPLQLVSQRNRTQIPISIAMAVAPTPTAILILSSNHPALSCRRPPRLRRPSGQRFQEQRHVPSRSTRLRSAGRWSWMRWRCSRRWAIR